MKSLVYIALISLVVSVSAMSPLTDGNSNTGEGIQFQSGSWNEVLLQAKKENKLIFLDIYTSWCVPCKLLKSKTFPNVEVGNFYNSNFINYSIDAEKGEGITLAAKYNVEGFPTLLFVDNKGKIVAKNLGYYNAEEFLDLGYSVADKNIK